jgi:VCBS repeat-containing protein
VLSLVSASAPSGQGSASVVAGEVQFDPGSDFDHLAEGATANVTVSYTMQDEHGAQSSSTVTITVTGTNDGPVAHADSGSATENQVISVDVLANDTDADDGHVLSLVSASAPSGQGSASVVAGEVQFDPGSDFDHLAEGATASVTVSYTMQDEHGAQSSSTVTITVTGTNDAPELSASVTSGTYTDSAADDSFGNITGTLSTIDPDAGDSAAYSIDGGVVDLSHLGYDTSASSAYGTLYLDSSSGAYEFVPDDAAIEARKSDDDLSFTLIVTDGHSATDSATLAIHIDGENDTPLLSATLTSATFTDTADDDSFSAVSGDLSSTDRDSPETATYGVLGGVSDNSLSGYDISKASAYGTLYVDSATGNYTFVPNDAAIEGLKTDPTLFFTLQVTDGSGVTANQTLTVNLDGANDTPELTAVADQSYDDTSGDDHFGDISGTLHSTDRDLVDSATYTVAGGSSTSELGFDQQVGTDYGTLYLDSTSGNYKFVPSDGAIEGLKTTDHVDFVFTITDADGAHDSDTLTISLNGVNDMPEAPATNSVTTDEDTASLAVAIGASDRDAGETFTYSVKAGEEPSIGSVNFDQGAGTFTYTPDPDANGSDSFTILVTDAGGSTTEQVVSVTVNPVNDDPVSADGSGTSDEDTALSSTLPGATDVDGDSVGYALDGQASHGTAAVNANGTFTYTPDADFNGSDSFSFSVSDGNGGSNTYTYAVTVNPVNDNPVSADGAGTTDEDVTLNGTLPAASDVDGDSVGYALDGQASHGAAAVNANGTFTYTPDADFNGSDSFTFTVSDGNGGSNTYTYAVTVDPVNDAPVASDESYVTAEDTPLTVNAAAGVLGNDSDVDGDSLSVVPGTVATAHGGSVTFAADGSFTYAPAANFNGTDTVNYTLTDGQAFDTGTVTLTVSPVNDAPVSTDGSGSTDEEVALISSLPGATDVDGDSVSYALDGQASHGTAAVNANGTFTYTPDADFNGSDSFAFSVSDGNGGSNTYTYAVTVDPVNDAPVANADSVSTAEDTPVTFDVRTNDTDVDGDSLTVTQINGTAISVGSPVTITGGSISLEADGRLTYTPTGNFNGSPSFNYTISDGHGGTSTATANLTVTAVNDAPIATITPATLSATEGVSLDLKANGLSISDVDANGGSVTVTLSVGEGTLNADVGNSGVLLLGSGTPSLTITGLVSQVNAFLGAIGSSSTLAYVDTSDTPAASTTLTLSVHDNGNSGAGGDLSSSDTATINITAVNDAPVNGLPASFATNEDTPVKLAGLSVSDADAGAAPINVTLAVGSGTLSASNAGGVSVTGSGTGSIVLSGSQADINTYLASVANQPTYTPVANASGAVTLTMITSDNGNSGSGGAQTDTDFSTISITSVNDAPAGTDGTVTTIEDTTKIFAAGDFGFTDPNDSPANAFAAVQIMTLPGAGVLKLDGIAVTAGQLISVGDINAGKLSFVPTPDVPGTTSLTFKVQDDGGTANGGVNLDPTANTLVIEITPVNDAPVNTVPGAQSATGGSALAIGGVSVFDSDSGNLTTTLSVAHGTLNVSSIVGVTITGNGTGSVQLVGDQFSINQALSGLSYTATAGYNGGDSLSVSTSDGLLSDLDSVAINVSSAAVANIKFVPNGNDFNSTLPAATDQIGSFVAYDAAGNAISGATFAVTAGSAGSLTVASSGVVSGVLSNGNIFNFSITSGGVTETVHVEVGNGSPNTITGTDASIDILWGVNNSDTLNGAGNDDTLYGNDVADTLNGGDNDDFLIGGNNGDTLNGGNGNDYLRGGVGNDILNGGSGSDLFVFNVTPGSANADTIQDFNATGDPLNGDKIGLEDSIFTAIGSTLDATEFRAGAGVDAQDSNDFILFDTANGNLYYDADGNGAGAKVLIATINLPGLTGTLDPGDFLML